MAELGCRVVKLGGSLLECADLVERWSAWLARQSPDDVLRAIGRRRTGT